MVQGIDRYFVEPYRPEKVKEILDVFRTKVHIATKGIKEVSLNLLKSGPANREKVLDWFHATLTRYPGSNPRIYMTIARTK